MVLTNARAFTAPNVQLILTVLIIWRAKLLVIKAYVYTKKIQSAQMINRYAKVIRSAFLNN